MVELLYPLDSKTGTSIELLESGLQLRGGLIIEGRKHTRRSISARVVGKHELEMRFGLAQVRDQLKRRPLGSRDRSEQLFPREND